MFEYDSEAGGAEEKREEIPFLLHEYVENVEKVSESIILERNNKEFIVNIFPLKTEISSSNSTSYFIVSMHIS